MTIPVVTRIPTTSLFFPSLFCLSFTLEKNTPTIITDRMLHDLTMITTGYDVSTMAILYVRVAVNTAPAQKSKFFLGIYDATSEENQVIKAPTIHPER